MHTKTQTENHGTKTPRIGTQDNGAMQGTKEKQCLDLPLLLPCYHFLSFSISWTKKKGCVCVCLRVCVRVLSRVQFFVASWIVVRQAPLSMEFSRQECWSRLLFPTPGDLPNPGIKPMSPGSATLAVRFFTTEPPEKPQKKVQDKKYLFYNFSFWDHFRFTHSCKK